MKEFTAEERQDFKDKVIPTMLKLGISQEDADGACDYFVDYIENRNPRTGHIEVMEKDFAVNAGQSLKKVIEILSKKQ